MPDWERQAADLKIAICDDIPRDAEAIRSCVGEFMSSSGLRCAVDVFSSGETLLDHVETKRVRYDLCFVDVLMKGIDGLETASAVKAALPGCRLVFVTSSHEFAVEAFSLNALHYLVKPVAKEQIAEVFRRCSGDLLRPSITVFDGTDQVKVFLDSILYLESTHDSNAHSYTQLVTESCRITARLSLSKAEALVGENFLKLHRGLIVNMDFIGKMGMDRCVLKNGTEEILSRSARGEIRERYKNYLSNRIKNLGAEL